MLTEKLLKGQEATTAAMSWLFTKDSNITPPTRPSNALGFIPNSVVAAHRILVPVTQVRTLVQELVNAYLFPF